MHWRYLIKYYHKQSANIIRRYVVAISESNHFKPLTIIICCSFGFSVLKWALHFAEQIKKHWNSWRDRFLLYLRREKYNPKDALGVWRLATHIRVLHLTFASIMWNFMRGTCSDYEITRMFFVRMVWHRFPYSNWLRISPLHNTLLCIEFSWRVGATATSSESL